jgi:hypothetical protein
MFNKSETIRSPLDTTEVSRRENNNYETVMVFYNTGKNKNQAEQYIVNKDTILQANIFIEAALEYAKKLRDNSEDIKSKEKEVAGLYTSLLANFSDNNSLVPSNRDGNAFFVQNEIKRLIISDKGHALENFGMYLQAIKGMQKSQLIG